MAFRSKQKLKGHDMPIYDVHLETRPYGSIGNFDMDLFTVEADNHSKAIEIAIASAYDMHRLECRFTRAVEESLNHCETSYEKLIAAAPEMLAALINCEAFLDVQLPNCAQLIQVREALRKAEGKS